MTLSLSTKIDRITQKRDKLSDKIMQLSKQIGRFNLELEYLNNLNILEKAQVPQHSLPVLAGPPRQEGPSSGVPLPVPVKPQGDCSSCSDGVTRAVRRTLGNGKTITLRVCGDCGNESLT